MDENHYFDLPTPAEAAAMLVEASAVDVETDRGETIELWTISSDGPLLTGSGPRLNVAGGMTVTCRLAHGGQPVQVQAVIEEAEYRSQSRASLVLRVVEVSSHGYRRQVERLSVNSSASLRSVICDRIPPNEVLPVTLSDLSEAGCAVTLTDGRLREGDRVGLSARFLEGEVVADARIARLHSPAPDVYVAGCYFIGMPAASQVVLERVLGRLSGNARPASDMGALRATLAEEPEPAKPLKQEQAGADEAYWTFAKRSAARIPTARRAV
jgi:PilZ domain-containing protein